MNHDQWEIEVYYTESDYDESKDRVRRIPAFWRDKENAKIALNEIKERREMIGNLHFRTIEDIGDEKRDWMVFHENGRLLQFKIALLMEDGTRKTISSFWDEDNFLHLHKMKIVRETFVEEDDEIIF